MYSPGYADVDHDGLFGIAYAAVYELVSPSARSNLTEQIAADTIEQYLKAVDSGEEIHNPHAWVQIRARWRALDAMRQWKRRKERTRSLDEERQDDGQPAYLSMLSRSLRNAIRREDGDPASIVVEREWIRGLIEATFPDDPTNRRLAIACLVEGAKPREVAEDFDMDAKVISNRLGRIRAKLLDELPHDERW
jgi:DNA-directed RNA polymerase specialized sigma24 family protein